MMHLGVMGSFNRNGCLWSILHVRRATIHSRDAVRDLQCSRELVTQSLSQGSRFYTGLLVSILAIKKLSFQAEIS